MLDVPGRAFKGSSKPQEPKIGPGSPASHLNGAVLYTPSSLFELPPPLEEAERGREDGLGGLAAPQGGGELQAVEHLAQAQVRLRLQPVDGDVAGGAGRCGSRAMTAVRWWRWW